MTKLLNAEKLLSFFIAPFKSGFTYFCFFLYTSFAALLIYEPAIRGWKYTAHLFIIALGMSYLMSLLSVLRFRWHKVLLSILMTFSILNLIVDVISFCTTSSEFSDEHVALFMGTNLQEGSEFLLSYINFHVLLIVALFFIGLGLTYFISGFISRSSTATTAVTILFFSTIVASSVSTNILKTESWRVVSFGKIPLFFEYTPATDLSDYRQNPTITFSDDSLRVQNIVVIIGESHARSHSSLYGYDKLTNPKIDSILSQDNSSCLFLNACSPEVSTVKSFRKIFTTYSCNNQNIIDWKDCITIFDVARQANFYTHWISNQSQSGIHDNQIARLAELCDSVTWVGATAGTFKSDYDEVLLPRIKSSIPENRATLTFINLMGSHPKYSLRFPDSFSQFTINDYLEFPQHQRQTLADYDNSLLYNDFILSQIINIYNNNDAIILYFSDHGQDLYQTNPAICGHARENDASSCSIGKEIPAFIVATGSTTGDAHTYMYSNKQMLKNISESYFNTENVIYLISSFMGIETINGDSILNKLNSCE